MLAGLRVWWRALRHLHHRGYIYVWGNLFWIVLSLPIITAPAAWAGLMRMSHMAHHDSTADINDLWDGFKENLGRGFVLTLLNFVVIGINLTNLISYQGISGVGVLALRVVWIAVLLVWLTVQLFMWPLYYEMQYPTIFGAMRNAAVLLLQNPLFTVSIWLGIALLLAFSTAFPGLWLLVTGALLAIMANAAVLDRLRAAGLRPPEVLIEES